MGTELVSLRGRLLVANPALPDANFHRTVVFMIEHNEEGTLGVVLNRPSTTSLEEALPDWGAFAAYPPVLFVGGPVEPSAAICLASIGGEWEAGEGQPWRHIAGDVGTLDLSAGAGPLGDRVPRLRVFAGYAGWAVGQLVGELALGAWFVVDPHPDDVLSRQPMTLWRSVLRRQGGLRAALANYPDDASVN